MRSVDTNLLVRLIARDDEKQYEAAKSFILLNAWVAHLVLAETIWVLGSAYDRTSAQIADAVDALLANESLVVQEPEVVEAALVQFRKLPSISFSDCLILETARKSANLPLGTFDRRLSKLDNVVRVDASR